jgi:hypothetical protein
MGPMGLVGPMGPYGPIPCQTNAYIHIYIYMYIFIVNAKRTSGGQAIPGTHIYIYMDSYGGDMHICNCFFNPSLMGIRNVE